MQIDWFTVVAQIFNFLILVWLLKRFLYKPILAAIDAREQLIARRLQEAAATEKQATTEREKFAASNAELEQQRKKLLEQATEAAGVERQKLLKEAHAAADAVTSKRQQDQRQQLLALRADIHRLTVNEVIALTRKILGDLSQSTLEQSMINLFSAQLHDMAPDSRKALTTALTSAPAGGLVCSAFILNTEQQQQLQNTINVWTSAAVPLQFDTSDQLICGLELSAKGQKTAWNIAAYLDELEAALTTQLAATGSTDTAEPKHA